MKTCSLRIGCVAVVAVSSLASAGEFPSRYYVIETNLPRERAEQFGRVMDAAGQEYHRLFSGFRGKVREKPRVKIFATKAQYLQAFARSCGEPNANARGVFCHMDKVVYTYVGDDDDGQLEAILKHECFHQFADSVVGGGLPTWTNEGLAEYFSEGEFNTKTGRLALGAVPGWRLKLLREARKNRQWIPVARLLTIDGRSWSDTLRRGRGGVQYSEAWLLCHFLIHADRGKFAPLFDQYLSLLDQSQDGLVSFKRVFGDDLAPLEQQLVAYLDGLKADDAKKPTTAHGKKRPKKKRAKRSRRGT